MLNKKQIACIKTAVSSEHTHFPLIFRALGDPCRFAVFKLLMQHHNLCVTDISRVFGITVSAASQQLRVLEHLNLVQKIRTGQMVCYTINREHRITTQLIALFSSAGRSAKSGKGRIYHKKRKA